MTGALWSPGRPPLIAWYGDDLTGTTAALEILDAAGLPGLVVLSEPGAAAQVDLGDVAAIGLASTARSEGPEWMEAHLPDALRWLAGRNPEILHYKICSTLDSSPETGSIGRAADIIQTILGPGPIPCLPAAPSMGRYQAFGTLFARGPDGAVHRLDRHPVMARHPVTPMHEADVGRHLALQTDQRIETIPLNALRTGASIPGDRGIYPMDACDGTDMRRIGALLWANRTRMSCIIGSQGVQIALVEHWRESGLLPPALPRRMDPAPAVVASGSVSETTAAQIRHALKAGFTGIALDPLALLNNAHEVADGAAQEARRIVKAGRLPLLHTAWGPDDERVRALRHHCAGAGCHARDAQRTLAEALGLTLGAVLRRTGLPRAIVAGGDSSGHAVRALGGYALRPRASGQAGCALFKLAAHGPHDGLEIALKGGQMGEKDIFTALSLG